MNRQGTIAKLTDEALRAMKQNLAENGYVVLEGMVSREPLAELHLQLLESYRTSAKFAGGGSILGHLNCFPGEAGRFVYDELRECGLVDAILAGRPGRCNDMFARVNWNLPGSSAQHWHMDGTFVSDFIVCNVAIVDIDWSNGPTEVIPGSHRRFYPYWRFVAERTARLSTPVPLSRGDVLIRTSTLWHRGTANRSGSVRPLMSLSFGEKEAGLEDPFSVNDGEITFYPNWYSNATRTDILRERLEKALPITRSAGRLAKSLIGERGYDSY
jgi:Phytanoyl-CoA dioxygenase (PhyH)